MFGLENYIIAAIIAVFMLIVELLTMVGFGLAVAITMFIISGLNYFFELSIWQNVGLFSVIGIFVVYFVMKKFKRLNKTNEKDVNDYS